jgi:hypothetical protein
MAILFKLLILFMAVPVFAEDIVHHTVQFGGIDEYHDAILINENDSTKAVNVLTDEGDLRSIYGNKLYSTIATSSVTFQAEYVDTSGGHSIISKSGLKLYETDTAGATTAIKTFTTEREIDSVSAFDKIYFADSIEAIEFDGTSVSASTMAAWSYV